jgi:hypothetical protein
MLALMLAQLALGFLAFVTKVVHGGTAAQPQPAMVWSTVSHVAVGALLMATAVILAIQAFRHLALPVEEALVPAARRAAIAARPTSARSATPEATL